MRIQSIITFCCLLISVSLTQCKTGNSHAPTPADTNIFAVRSIDPLDTNYQDLAALRSAIGNASVVLLGEQTHGEGATFLAKTRLIQFLHEKMDFDVLAFESGMYDVPRIWENTKKGGELSNEVKGSLFYMYATSKQMAPLFRYLQASLQSTDPMSLTGFESQHSGVNAKNTLFPDFEAFLKTFAPTAIDANWKTFKQVSVATFSSRSYRPSDIDKQVFLRKLAELKSALSAHEKDPVTSLLQSAGFWYRVVASIESQALRYWEMVQGNEVSVRDKQMAENLIWLAEHAYPGKKIIVWAHNIHIAKQIAELSFPPQNQAGFFFSSFIPMGATVSKHFGEQSYHIGFTSSEGKYQDYSNDQFVNIPAPVAGTIEDKLNATNYPFAFAALRNTKGWWQQPQTGMLYDFMPVKGKWAAVYDGVFFIRKNNPVDR